MPLITHLLVLLYNLGHCWIVIFHARPLAFWDLTGLIQFWTLWIFQCRGHDLPRCWLRCRCIGFYIWKSIASRCWCSSGCIKASMSRCLSCPFSFFSFCSLLFFLLSLFFLLCCLLSLLTFSVTYNAIYEFLHKLQRLHYDHFTISHAVQIRVIHPWLLTPGMNFGYTIFVIGIA